MESHHYGASMAAAAASAHQGWQQHEQEQQQRVWQHAAAAGAPGLHAELHQIYRICDDRLLRLEAWQACTDAGAEGVSQVRAPRAPPRPAPV